jgi:hypothetical protein
MLNPEPRTLNLSSLSVVLAALVLTAVTGCPPSGKLTIAPEEPMSMSEVIARANENNRQMDFVLNARGISAHGRWQQSPGSSDQSTSFDMTGIMLYRKPRSLYLRLQPTLGGKLEVGSNDQQFWVWERIKTDHYWWGEYKWMKDADDSELPVRPDVLVDVLGLGDLPTDTTGPHGPVFWVREDVYQVVFLDQDQSGQSYITKVTDISRRPPFLPCSILYFDPDGRPTMRVSMSDYKPIEGSKVLAPRQIVMQSTENDNHMELDFRSMVRLDEPGANRAFISPMQQGVRNLGRVTRVDNWVPAPPPLPPRTTRPASRASLPAGAETKPIAPATRSSVPDQR